MAGKPLQPLFFQNLQEFVDKLVAIQYLFSKFAK